MNKREELARQAFKEGYNCSQAMVAAFSDLMGMDKKTALRLASSFGGGMGRRYLRTCTGTCKPI